MKICLVLRASTPNNHRDHSFANMKNLHHGERLSAPPKIAKSGRAKIYNIDRAKMDNDHSIHTLCP